MKSRIVWCSPQIVSDDAALNGLRTVISSVDRYAFWSGLLIAICGWAYISVVRASDEARVVWRERLRQSLPIYAAAALAVVITVASDAILTALRLLPAGQVAILFPCLTIGLEVAPGRSPRPSIDYASRCNVSHPPRGYLRFETRPWGSPHDQPTKPAHLRRTSGTAAVIAPIRSDACSRWLPLTSCVGTRRDSLIATSQRINALDVCGFPGHLTEELYPALWPQPFRTFRADRQRATPPRDLARDIRMQVEDRIIDADKVVARCLYAGTHAQTVPGLRANRQRISFRNHRHLALPTVENSPNIGIWSTLPAWKSNWPGSEALRPLHRDCALRRPHHRIWFHDGRLTGTSEPSHDTTDRKAFPCPFAGQTARTTSATASWRCRRSRASSRTSS